MQPIDMKNIDVDEFLILGETSFQKHEEILSTGVEAYAKRRYKELTSRDQPRYIAIRFVRIIAEAGKI
jgi:hypothetical protein